MDFIAKKSIRISIIGAAGYTGGELIRIALAHPDIKLQNIHSSSQAGKAVGHIHQDLLPYSGLIFDSEVSTDAEVYFLCMGHGRSGEFIATHRDMLDGKVVIDLSNEFRLHGDHGYVYGLPEAFRQDIRGARKIANPGCFATAIQLGFLPLAYANLLSDHIHVHGITGSTGAGQQATPTTHFAWRSSNLSIYKGFTHQHIPEIERTWSRLQPSLDNDLLFVPIRGDFARGIFMSGYTTYGGSLQQALDLYQKYYSEHPFVTVTDQDIHLKQVVNTNHCLLQLRVHHGMLHVTSIIDNLLKGASGQAIQNMNLIFGLAEDAGLQLKATYY